MSVPAVVQNGRLDLLAANDLGRALYADLFTMGQQPPNIARYVFLDPRAEAFYADIDEAKNQLVAVLRATAGRDPLDMQVTELIGELSTRGTDFSTRWAKHNVRRHSRGRKIVNHPAVGRMDLAYDDFALPGDPHVSITTYTADPGTPSADGLTLLATWADTRKQPRTANDEVRRTRPVTLRCSVCSAGHLPPVVVHRDGHGPRPAARRRSATGRRWSPDSSTGRKQAGQPRVPGVGGGNGSGPVASSGGGM